MLIDQEAIPTVVEVKRSTDTRIRREVVGQMLEYAANAVVYWPVEVLRARFERTCVERNKVAEDELATFLGAESDPGKFWSQVKTNLQAGRIRLVFVADEIPRELRRIIEFMNEQMDPAEVLGVEIKQYVAGNTRTLVPTVIGQTEEALQRKSTGGIATRQWDEETFFAELRNSHTPTDVNAAAKILEWSKANATRVYFGKGTKSGNLVPVIHRDGIDYQLGSVTTNATFEVYFQWLQKRPAFQSEESRMELMKRLNAIPGVAIKPTWITQRPPIRLSILNEEALSQFIAVLDWVLQVINEYHTPTVT